MKKSRILFFYREKWYLQISGIKVATKGTRVTNGGQVIVSVPLTLLHLSDCQNVCILFPI